MGLGSKGLVFCRNNGWLIGNTDKGLTENVPKWVLINRPKIPTPNAPKFIHSDCLPEPECLEFQWKKASLGVRSPWLWWRDGFLKKIFKCVSKYMCFFILNLSFGKIMCNKCEFKISRKSKIVPLGLVTIRLSFTSKAL